MIDGPGLATLARVIGLGSPWHGPVQDSVLTLPNGATMDYPQPGGVTGLPWTFASTYYVRRPAWVAAERSEAQIEADIAAGREWRDYALLSGTARHYCGQPLNGFLWFDGSGATWLVRLYAVTGNAASMTWTVSFTPFGRFASSVPDVVFSVSAPFSLQQTGAPVLHRRSSSGGSPAVVPDTFYEGIVPVSCSPDGSKQLFMAYATHYPTAYNTGRGTLQHLPLAFIELVVASDKSVTVSTIRNRAACMGGFSESSNPAGTKYSALERWVALNYTNPDWTVLPDCPNGGTPRHRTIYPLYEEFLHGDDDYWLYSYRHNTPHPGQWSADWSNQIIAMWYDAAGTLHEITASIKAEITVSVTVGHESLDGERTEAYTCSVDGNLVGPFIDGALRWERSETIEQTEEFTVTLRDNGAVTDASYSWVNAQRYEFSIGGTWASAADSPSMTRSLTGDGSIIEQGNTVATWSFASSSPPSSSLRAFDALDASSRIFPAMTAPDWSANRYDVLPHTVFTGISSISREKNAIVEVVRWSNHAVGMHVQRGDGAAFGRHRFGDALTMAGVVAIPAELDTLGVTSGIVVSGSLQPVTGQLITSIAIRGSSAHLPTCLV